VSDVCEFNSKVDAFHDGELDAATMQQFEAHLATCAPCREELRALRAMSRWIEARRPDVGVSLSDAATSRLHAEVSGVMERSLTRLAGSFAAIAASVLIAATIGLMTLPRATGGGGAIGGAAGPEAWESSAFASNVDVSSSSSAIDPELILIDLSRGATR
jgi:anti-sigma factor RsiW